MDILVSYCVFIYDLPILLGYLCGASDHR